MDNERTPSRILAIKLADLGDLLLCEPAFRSLRTAFPDASIDVLTTPSSVGLLPLIGHNLNPVLFPKQLFDSVRGLARPTSTREALRLARRIRGARYDRVVIFHHLTTAFGARKFHALVRATGCTGIVGLDNGRGTFLTSRVADLGFGAMHEAAYMLAVAITAGGANVAYTPVIMVPECDDIADELPEAYAAIFPAAGPFSRAREWFPERFAETARRLADRGITPVVVGGLDAREAAEAILQTEQATIDLTGRTSLTQLAHVLHRAQMAIGGDTFIGHLAAAVGTPVVSIFGPSNADAWRPAGSVDAGTAEATPNTSVIVRSALPCQPCVYTGFRLGRPEGCPDRTCLRRMTVRDVDRAISGVLGET